MDEDFIPESIKFIPSGNPFLVFNLGDDFHIYNQQHREGLRESGNIIVGQQDSYYLLSPGKRLINFCIIFQPTGFYRLFKNSIGELINNSVTVELILKHKLFSNLQSVRSTAIKPELIVAELEDIFCKQMLYNHKKHTYIEHSIDLIHKTKGMTTIRELADNSNTCERNYRRRFTEIAGISPKKYIQIIRLQNIFHTVSSTNSDKINWCDFSYNMGYYDQMHFIKEFKKFCGESPGKYFSDYNKDEKTIERDLIRVTY
jgi:AraC-like DNA-binding protein